MNTSPENEIKKIYEKSVRLLNDKQARLMDMRQILKKAVIRLSTTSYGDNEQVNNVLNEIKLTVDDHVDLQMLNTHLDNLFVLINHADFRPGGLKNKEFYKYLEKSLGSFNNSSSSAEFILQLKALVNKKLPDDKMSSELLNTIDSIVSTDIKHNKNLNEFIKEITDSTDFKYERKGNDASKILQDLAIELTKYIYTIDDGGQNTSDKTQSNDHDSSININGVLTEIVNQLTLPSESKKEQFKLTKLLHKTDNNNETWKNAIHKLVLLVNQSIGSIQVEKQEMEVYLTKINIQLADIESFMLLMRRDSEESRALTSELTESVETDVLSIETSVSNSTDLTGLKKDVAENLKEIRKHVEEYKQAEQEKDDISAQSYAQIIDELVEAQKESSTLKEQLHESKSQLLRDTLTGIPNRLAYDERVMVEINRWKRTKAPLCLAMWDIDHFKSVNDDFGHGVGDRVLKLFSEIIQSRIRKVDHFARIGGEEFVLLMPDTPLDIALTLNNKLREKLEACNFHYDGKHCPITASVGIAEFQIGDEVEDVMERADQALYQSKNEGRNRCTANKGEASL